MRKATAVIGAMLLVGAGALFVWAAESSAQPGNNGQSEVQRGFDIAPVPLNLSGKNRSLVGQGSYYVNGVSDCIGCHTAEGGGYLGGVSRSGRSSAGISRRTSRGIPPV